MQGLNKVTLLGNLGADPEIRYTQSGQAVLNMRLATPERFKSKDGQWAERTEWHNVVVWGARAEALSKLLVKGSAVLVEGSLRTSSYDAKDGTKRYKTDVHASNVILCGRKPDGPGGYGDRGPSKPAEDSAPANYDDGYDAGDLPF